MKAKELKEIVEKLNDWDDVYVMVETKDGKCFFGEPIVEPQIMCDDVSMCIAIHSEFEDVY